MKASPVDMGRAVRLRLDGKTQSQIAGALGTSQATVCRAIRKARDMGLLPEPPPRAPKRLLGDGTFLRLFNDALFRGTLRKEVGGRRHGDDAEQAAWERILTIEDGKPTGFYLTAGKWAIRDFYRRETRAKP